MEDTESHEYRLSQYSLIKLAHQAQVEARKITLEQVALAARGPEQIQDPAKPKM